MKHSWEVFNLRAKEERGQDEEKMLFFVARNADSTYTYLS